MTRKEVVVTITTGFLSGLAGVALALSASSGAYGAKIEALEKRMVEKADAGAIVELATRSDVRAIGDQIASSTRIQDRRDAEQDRRIDTMEKVQSEQGRTLARVDRNLEVVIAILDPDGRVARNIKH